METESLVFTVLFVVLSLGVTVWQVVAFYFTPPVYRRFKFTATDTETPLLSVGEEFIMQKARSKK